MLRFSLLGVSLIAVATAPAIAGEAVLYEPAPAWVEPLETDAATIADGPAEQVYDWQHRLENGVVHTYGNRVVRIDNAEALTQEGTLKYSWSPDKGDLFIHALEILRDGETIDVLAGDVRFDVIRREENLEQRLLDGRLTATLAIPDLREGDVLRVAHSTTIADQALGDRMQAAQFLPSSPWRVGVGRVVASWPEALGVDYRAGPFVELDAPTVRDGYRTLTVSLPLEKREDMPDDAPVRFRMPPILRIGNFDSYQDLSRVMAPHFLDAAKVEAGDPVDRQAQAIMAKTDVPLERAALATRLVQDQVSYLLNGLDGGNYLPQQAGDTWAKRYGDCKAKSVLLLALLKRMDIDAEVVLVSTRTGDALPELLPIPANFDHMIVRATIDGREYWLDGTSTATRLNNIDAVPPFHHALPLTLAGGELTPLSSRDPSHDDMVMTLVADHSAGVDLPMLFDLTIKLGGPASAAVERLVDENDPEVRKQIARSFGTGDLDGAQVGDIDIAYDGETATGTIVISGVASSLFDYSDGRTKADFDLQTEGADFSPNRARAIWRDIPVTTGTSARNRIDSTIRLPDSGKGYTFTGTPALDDGFGTTRYFRAAGISGDTVNILETVTNRLGEIAPADIAEARRNATRIAKSGMDLIAPADAVWRWQRDAKTLARLTAPARVIYDKAVAEADDDDFLPLETRAAFHYTMYDYARAAADYDTLIAERPTSNHYYNRAESHLSLGRLDRAIDDLQASYDLDPYNSTAYYLSQILVRAGRAEEALALLDMLPVEEDERDDYINTKALVMGLTGDVPGGLQLLQAELDAYPDNATLLGGDCWFRGMNKAALDDAVAQCTRAVERSQYPAGVLDSRALVHHRLGDDAAALSDLDAALKLDPSLADSRYLRGIIRLRQGDRDGRADIESALRQKPELKDYYALFGVAPTQ